MRLLVGLLAIVLLLCVGPKAALAYIGPGPGLGVLGALMALLAGVFLAGWIVVRWLFRSLIWQIRGKPDSAALTVESDIAHENKMEQRF